MRRKSFSVVKQRLRIESRSKRDFYILLAVMIGIISFLFIPDLMMIYANGIHWYRCHFSQFYFDLVF
jgi:hypothetical protein